MLVEIYQSGLTTQISTHPRATQQGRVKCRRHITVPAVLTKEAIPEEGRKKLVEAWVAGILINSWDQNTRLLYYSNSKSVSVHWILGFQKAIWFFNRLLIYWFLWNNGDEMEICLTNVYLLFVPLQVRLYNSAPLKARSPTKWACKHTFQLDWFRIV